MRENIKLAAVILLCSLLVVCLGSPLPTDTDGANAKVDTPVPIEQNEEKPETSTPVTVVENKFTKKKDGSYEHYIELSDETIHREMGKFIDGEFVIQGYFLYPSDKNKMHIYLKDKEGLNYFVHTLNDGIDDYSIEDQQICNENLKCIAPSCLISLCG